MNLHTLQPVKGARRAPKRVGRGRASGMGKTSTRGHKGQMSRAGHKHKPTFEGGQMPLARRIPKRGFKNVSRKVYMPVNLSALDRFDDGAEVTLEMLREAGLARGTVKHVKILGQGEISKKLTVKAHAFSTTAKEKIETAGGVCEIVQE